MYIINPVLNVLSIVGLSFLNVKSKTQTVLYIFWVTVIGIFVFGLIMFSIVNIRNPTTIFQELMFTFGESMVLLKALSFFPRKKHFLELYDALRNNMNSRYFVESNIYDEAEKKGRLYYGVVSITTCVTVFYMTVQPLFTWLHKYLNGILYASDWIHPVQTELFYDNKNTPGFQFAYVHFMITWYGSSLIVAGIDSLFIGIGLHIVAGFKDLQKMILSLDDIIIKNNNARQWKNSQRFLRQMSYCIEFHNFVLKCQDRLQALNSLIIFTTVCGILMMLCSLLFRITKTDAEVFVALAGLTCAVNCMILSYAFTGNLVTAEGLNIAIASYDGLWYMCPGQYRKYYLYLIQNGQKSRYMHGLYFFNCSLETFSNVVKASFSIAAIMRNVG